MRHLLNPHSRIFRSLLILAVLGWSAFAVEAAAHPLGMNGQTESASAPATSDAASPPCDGMAMAHAATPAASTSIPAHSVSGHGCCAFGHCACAASCSGVAAVPSLAMTWPPLRDPVLVPVHADVLPGAAPPHLRPPIA